MYTRRIFPIRGVISWTRRYILMFLIIATIPVFLFEVLRWKWLHVPWLPLGVLGTAVAFIVSFKNNASYDRLWEARKIWGGIVNTSRTWTIMVKDFITNDHAREPLSEEKRKALIKELVHRHVAWLTALRYQLRQDKPWEMHLKSTRSNKEFRDKNYTVPEDTEDLEEVIRRYISEEEFNEVFAKGNRASQLLGVQSRRLRELLQEGMIEDFRHMEMANVLKEFYALQGKSERIKNFPYPRQFATLNYIFVWIFIILLPFGIMEGFQTIGEEIVAYMNANETYWEWTRQLQLSIGKHFVWFSIPFSALLAWVFHTMEAIGENTENPFEGGPNDVPISDLSRGIEIDIRQMIDDTDIPAPYEWKKHIVM
ncbi:MAG: hypothetical protein HKP11_13615 [Flavobacteriaceae bacterium]|nr:hypothetical protein [Flavobacteriaceae bacterium]